MRLKSTPKTPTRTSEESLAGETPPREELVELEREQLQLVLGGADVCRPPKCYYA